MVFALKSWIRYVNFLYEAILADEIITDIAFNIGLNKGTNYKACLEQSIDLNQVSNKVSNFG